MLHMFNMFGLFSLGLIWSLGSAEVVENSITGETVSASCTDTHESCSFWAGIGECSKNPRYMLVNCPVSCDSCNNDNMVDEKVAETCKDGDGFCQASQAKVKVPKFANRGGVAREATAGCEDRYPDCAAYAAADECNRNPGWMIVNCPASCEACHLRDPAVRCKRENLNMSVTPVYQPGDMNAMFESLEKDYAHLGITVHSRDPWLVTFDNFLTDEEAHAIISTQTQWERSTDTGKANAFGETGRILSEGRTSTNSWCRGACENHPHVKSVVKRIETVTRIGQENYESFQVLRYDLGQKYITHHDYGVSDLKKASGPRILTFFLYLSDVEEGGETDFPRIGVRVTPKKGRAVLWPSTMDHDPEVIDARTHHQSLPVIKGRKFGANSWIHLYNFVQPNLWGCTGTFDDK